MEVHRYREHATPLLLTALLLLPVSRTMANDAIDFQVIHPQFGPTAPGPSYLAIRARAEFDATLQSFTTATPPLPVIDFDHYTLLMANAGPKPSGGYSIVFSSVHEVRQQGVPTVAVFLLDIGPGTCPRTEELTHAIAFALIPKTSEPIRFFVNKADRDCKAPPDSASKVS
jgi:hypothetical protein